MLCVLVGALCILLRSQGLDHTSPPLSTSTPTPTALSALLPPERIFFRGSAHSLLTATTCPPPSPLPLGQLCSTSSVPCRPAEE